MRSLTGVLVLLIAFTGTFGLVSLFESGVSSCEANHPELRAMVGSRIKFLLAFRGLRRISAGTLHMKPRPVSVRLWDTIEERSDETDSYLVPPSGQALHPPPNAVWYHFADLTDFTTRPHLVREAFGGTPRDCPVGAREDIEEAYRLCPLLRLIDREVFPFGEHFEAGAKLELRRYKHASLPGEEYYILHITGAPPPVSEGVHYVLNILREANGLPRQPSADEEEWSMIR